MSTLLVWTIILTFSLACWVILGLGVVGLLRLAGI